MRNPAENQNYMFIRHGRSGPTYRHKWKKGGRGVLKSRKAYRDPAIAEHMAQIRAHRNPNN